MENGADFGDSRELHGTRTVFENLRQTYVAHIVPCFKLRNGTPCRNRNFQEAFEVPDVCKYDSGAQIQNNAAQGKKNLEQERTSMTRKPQGSTLEITWTGGHERSLGFSFNHHHCI